MWVDGVRTAAAGAFRLGPRRGIFRDGWRRLNRALLKLGASSVASYRTTSGLILRVDLNADSQVDAYYTSRYEPESVAATVNLYDGAGTFLDVGANVGFYATAVAQSVRQSGQTGRLICFEPLPSNVGCLRENLAQNGLDAYCDIFELGLSDSAQELSLVLREDFRNGAKSGNASVAISDAMDAGFACTTIQVDTLDSFWARHGEGRARIDFVKVDIEGHEDCFFRGAQRTFSEHRPSALMEVNKAYFSAKGVDIDTTLRPFLPEGYRLLHHWQHKWREVSSFANCSDFENVLLVPSERLELARYREVLNLDAAVQ
jgi:FkbM family methyltransferase